MSVTFSEYKLLDKVDLGSLEAISEAFDISKVDALKKREDVLKTLKTIDSGIVDIKDYKVFSNVEQLTFAQFISIESSMQSVRDPYGLIIMVVSELLRPLSEEVYSNDNEGMNKAHRLSLLEAPAENIIVTFANFMEDRENFHYKKYKDVFLFSPEEDDEDTPETHQENNFYRNWHWYSYIRELSGEDITRYEEIMLLRMDLVAPEISYRQGLAKVRKQEEAERKAVSTARSNSRR